MTNYPCSCSCTAVAYRSQDPGRHLVGYYDPNYVAVRGGAVNPHVIANEIQTLDATDGKGGVFQYAAYAAQAIGGIILLGSLAGCIYSLLMPKPSSRFDAHNVNVNRPVYGDGTTPGGHSPCPYCRYWSGYQFKPITLVSFSGNSGREPDKLIRVTQQCISIKFTLNTQNLRDLKQATGDGRTSTVNTHQCTNKIHGYGLKW